MRRRLAALSLVAALVGVALTVVAASPAGAIPPPAPAPVVSPTSGAAGSDVTISGSCGNGGPGGVMGVHLILLDPQGDTVAIRTTVIGNNTFFGVPFSETLAVPAGAAIGTYRATYVCTEARSPEGMFATFQVTSTTADVATTTTVAAVPKVVPSNQSTTITATVTAGGQPVTEGTVLIGLANLDYAIVEVDDNGVATWSPDLPDYSPFPQFSPPWPTRPLRVTATYLGTAANLVSNTATMNIGLRPPVRAVAPPTITTPSGLAPFGSAIQGTFDTGDPPGSSDMYKLFLYYRSFTGGPSGVIDVPCCDGSGQWSYTLVENEPLPPGIYVFVAQSMDIWANFSPASNPVFLIVS